MAVKAHLGATVGGKSATGINGGPAVDLSAEDMQARVATLTAVRMLAWDAVVVTVAGLAAWASGPYSGSAVLALSALTLVYFALKSLYSTELRPTIPALSEARRLLAATLMATTTTVALAALAGGFEIDRAMVFTTVAWATSVVALSLVTRRRIRRRALSLRPERVLIVGAGTTGQRLARRIREHAGSRRQVVGFVDEDPLPLADDLVDVPLFDGPRQIELAIANLDPDRVVIAFTRRSASAVLEELRSSGAGRLPISVIPRYHEITPCHAEVTEMDGMPLINIQSAQLSRGAQVAKRALDLAIALSGVVLLMPLLLVIALAIKLTSKGPVLFGQVRTGRGGEPFRMWKFRTMRVGAESERFALADDNELNRSGPLFKIRRDPRVTWVGRFLRKYSIDEIPQLINVINGSMSLVGPRPFVVHEAEQMEGWSLRGLDLTPRMTGLWQVSGRNDVPYDEMIRLDYLYVANWSPVWDIRILLETIPAVVLGRGAS